MLPLRFHPSGEAVADTRPPTRILGAIPGEDCEVTPLGRGQHLQFARWRRAHDPSPDRAVPPCLQSDACGGCGWMHMRPEAARRWRRQAVIDALAAEGLRPQVDPVLHVPGADLGFRSVIKLIIAPDGTPGTWAHRSHDHLPIPGCLIPVPALRPFLSLRLPDTGGLIRAMIVRAAPDGSTLALLVAREDTAGVRRIAATLPADGVALHTNRRDGDGLMDPDGPTIPVCGLPHLEIPLKIGAGDPLTLLAGPGDFFQTNVPLFERLLAEILLEISADPPGPLLDLYCGVGAVGLSLAKAPGPGLTALLGVEDNAGAVARARANAARNGLGGLARFEAGRAADMAFPPEFHGATVLVDPPRKGLEDGMIGKILALQPRRLIYIACHPQPMARDLARLCGGAVGAGSAQGRMHLRRVLPCDMFPQTPHVETVAVLAPA